MAHQHTAHRPSAQRRSTSISLIVAGAGFAAFVLLRPWGDQAGGAAAAAAAFAEPRWVIAHAAGMVAWAAFAAAVSTAGKPAAGWLAGIGAACTLPYYGAEAFGLHGLATAVGDPEVVVRVAEAIRADVVGLSLFGVGLVLSGVAAVLLARRPTDVGWRRAALWIAAAGIATYLPQFFTPPGVRVAHGVVLGLALIALGLTRARAHPASAS